MRTTTAFISTAEQDRRQTHVLLRQLLKFLVLPFRFAWLLLVWLRLRINATRTSD
jgi:hypothetical protein